MRNPEIFDADEWRNPQFRLANADVIRMVAQDRLTDRTRAELFTEALGLGATVGVLHQPSEFVAHPQTRTRGFFVESGIERPRGAPVRDPTGEAGAHRRRSVRASQDADSSSTVTPPPSGRWVADDCCSTACG